MSVRQRSHAVIAGLTLTGATVSSCVHANRAAYVQPAATADTSAFAAILESVFADTSLWDTNLARARAHQHHVDPRSLRSVDAVMTTTQSWAPSSAREAVARTLVLRRLGALPDDATFPPECAGTMAQNAPGSAVHEGCPTQARRVVAISLLQDGDLTEQHAGGGDATLSTARVIIADFGPAGITAQLRDYVVRHAKRGWEVVKVKLRGFYE